MEILYEAPPVYCKGCNLAIAPGTRLVVQVGSDKYHDECWTRELADMRQCTGCGTHH